MALNNEQLSGFFQSSDLAGQISGAVAVIAEAVESESAETPNHTNRLKWAKRAKGSPSSVAGEMRATVFTTYRDTLSPSAPVLTDQQIQDAIANSVNTFADGT